MKKLLFGLVLVLSGAVCAEPQLTGTWQSERELSMRFTRKHIKLEPKTIAFLEQIWGDLTLEFGRGRVISRMPDVETTNAVGVISKLMGFSETRPLNVVAITPDQIATVSKEPVTGRNHITVYNFEDADTMWVYVGTANLAGMDIREYFVRVK